MTDARTNEDTGASDDLVWRHVRFLRDRTLVKRPTRSIIQSEDPP
jgi:hypothetical protein